MHSEFWREVGYISRTRFPGRITGFGQTLLESCYKACIVFVFFQVFFKFEFVFYLSCVFHACHNLPVCRRSEVLQSGVWHCRRVRTTGGSEALCGVGCGVCGKFFAAGCFFFSCSMFYLVENTEWPTAVLVLVLGNL